MTIFGTGRKSLPLLLIVFTILTNLVFAYSQTSSSSDSFGTSFPITNTSFDICHIISNSSCNISVGLKEIFSQTIRQSITTLNSSVLTPGETVYLSTNITTPPQQSSAYLQLTLMFQNKSWNYNTSESTLTLGENRLKSFGLPLLPASDSLDIIDGLSLSENSPSIISDIIDFFTEISCDLLGCNPAAVSASATDTINKVINTTTISGNINTQVIVYERVYGNGFEQSRNLTWESVHTNLTNFTFLGNSNTETLEFVPTLKQLVTVSLSLDIENNQIIPLDQSGSIKNFSKQAQTFNISWYKINIIVDQGGTVNQNNSTNWYQGEYTLRFTNATPDYGYAFAGYYVNGALESNNASFAYLVTEPATVEVKFAPIKQNYLYILIVLVIAVLIIAYLLYTRRTRH